MNYTFKLSRRLAAGHVWGAFVLLVLLGACDESPTDESASGTSAVESLAAKPPGKGGGRGRKNPSSLIRLVVSPDPAWNQAILVDHFPCQRCYDRWPHYKRRSP